MTTSQKFHLFDFLDRVIFPNIVSLDQCHMSAWSQQLNTWSQRWPNDWVDVLFACLKSLKVFDCFKYYFLVYDGSQETIADDLGIDNTVYVGDDTEVNNTVYVGDDTEIDNTVYVEDDTDVNNTVFVGDDMETDNTVYGEDGCGGDLPSTNWHN